LVLYRRPNARPQVYAGSGSVVFSRRQNSLDARVRHDRAEEVIVSESWMPGWEAEIDGAPVEVRKWKETLISVSVPSGDHQVRLYYRPRGLRLWLSISALTLAAALAFLVGRRVSLRGRPPG